MGEWEELEYLLFVNYCIFHMNCKPTFAPPCILSYEKVIRIIRPYFQSSLKTGFIEAYFILNVFGFHILQHLNSYNYAQYLSQHIKSDMTQFQLQYLIIVTRRTI